MTRPQPWCPADATDAIRELASGRQLNFIRTKHANEQMLERSLIVGDVLHVLKRGFVYDEPEPSTREGLFKYRMESSTPNSNQRTLRVVVIPCQRDSILKVVTVMWRDENTTGGSK